MSHKAQNGDLGAPVKPKPHMTFEQALASSPKLSAFVSASAGTGKTHVLTARVLRLMLSGTPPGNILCLTFTKAAAAEMLTRLFEELGRWTLMADAPLAAEINRRTGENPDDAQLERARSLFAQVLDSAGGLKVQTFHGFCQSLLGRFPLEAGLVPGFEGLEEIEAGRLLYEARARLLQDTQTPAGQKLRRALEKLAIKLNEDDFEKLINELSKHQKLLEIALEHYGPLGLVAATKRRLGLSADDSEARVLDDFVETFEANLEALAGLARIFGNKGAKTESDAAEKMAHFINLTASQKKDAFEDYTKIFLTQEGLPRKRIATKAVLQAAPEVEAIVIREQDRLADLWARLQKLKVTDATEALLEVGLHQLHSYRKMKQSRGLVDFDDMIRYAGALLAETNAAPWVLYKLDDQIDHILVDEAQDTNAVQWQIVEALAGEFFAGSGAREITRTVFAVGDVKQSIYSFQGARPEEFIAAEARLLEKARLAEKRAQKIPLHQSFRSGAAVLHLVDTVFRAGSLAAKGLGEELVHHDFTRTDASGLVELWPLEEPIPEKESNHWQAPLWIEDKDDALMRLAERQASHIAALIKKGDSRQANNKPVAAGDILVLVRGRNAFIHYLTRALRARSVPVAGRDRMALTAELPVKDLILLGEILLQAEDDLGLASLLKSPFFDLDDAALFELAYDRPSSLYKNWRKRAKTDEKHAQLLARFEHWARLADQLSPFEFYSHILDAEAMRTALARRLGNDCHDPIDEFLSEALAYEESEAASLRGFLSHLQKSDKTLKRDFETGAGEVRIMTVHASKGLQAPIVYLADTTAVPRGQQEDRLLSLSGAKGRPDLLVWAPPKGALPLIDAKKEESKEKRLAEYRRQLYVAMTRAEDRLYIIGARGKTSLDRESWYSLVSEGFQHLAGAKEIEPGFWRYEIMGGSVGALAKNIQQPSGGAPSAGDKGPTLGTVLGTVADLATEAQDRALPAWTQEGKPLEPNPARPLAPSRPDENPRAVSPLMATQKPYLGRGQLIHRLLELLPLVAENERAGFIKEFLSAPGHGLSAPEQLWIESRMRQLFFDPKLQSLWGSAGRSEVPVSGQVRGRLISGQIDRLLVTEDHIWIVDYKSDRSPPDEPKKVEEAYLVQMGLYKAAVAALYPQHPLDVFLLWTETGHLMALPDALLEQALEKRGLHP